MLSAFGTTNPFVVCWAALVSADQETLNQMARDIADHLGGENPEGEPGVKYRLIPHNERVWRMNMGGREHTRLGDDPWVSDELLPWRQSIVDVLRGRSKKLDFAA